MATSLPRLTTARIPSPTATQRVTISWVAVGILVMFVTAGLSQVVNQANHPNVPWLVGLAFGSFVLMLNGTALALVPVLVTELTLYSYYIYAFGSSQRFAITMLALVLTAPTVLRYARFGDVRMRRVLMPCILLVVIATAIGTIYSDSAYVTQYLRYQLVQVVALILAAALIRSRRDLLWLARIALVIAAIAAFAAIWQHYATSSAFYGDAAADTVKDWKGRVMGLNASPVGLANQLVFVLPVLLGYRLCGPLRFDRKHALLGFCMLIIAAGLNFTYTRSAVFALGPGLAVVGLLLHGRRRVIVVGFVIAMIFVFPLLENTGLLGARYFRDASDDQSAASHNALWEVGFAVAKDNMLTGIGHDHFEAVSVNYVDVVQDESATAPTGEVSVGNDRPHNDWLSVWLSWGIFALIAYALIFIGALRNFVIASRSKDLLIRGIAVGCAGGIVVYGVNSAYHNSMDSSVFLWLYAGISVALARMSVSTAVTTRSRALPRVHAAPARPRSS
jgi:O-antigen ligase